MRKITKKKQKKLEKQAATIAGEIFGLINQYTDDSATAKFFLPEEISASFYVAAGGFASVIYSPALDVQEIQNTHALTFFLVLITYGFQIYLRERSIKTHSAPYRLPTNVAQIERSSLFVFENAEKNELTSSPLADEIIDITLAQFEATTSLTEFMLDSYNLDEKKFYSYMAVSLYYGYNMAVELLKK